MAQQTIVGTLGFIVLAIHIGALTASGDPAPSPIFLDGSVPGRMFEGVGAVSGGGGTSVLLKDYPEPQREQILDLLFRPNFAASMQALYVEVGGDGNSTQGSEPTFARTRTDRNYSRGYEWWLMSEAKKRNPLLTLDGCAWSCPGWVGDGNFWSQDMADYYVDWIKGLKSHYGLEMDAIGCRNERGAVTDWVKLFRRTLDERGLKSVRIHAFDNPGNEYMWDWIPQLDTDKDLASAVDIISNHALLLGPWPLNTRQILQHIHKPLWNTEEHVYSADGRHYQDEYDCALGAAHLFNANYISRGATKIVNWYLVGSTYGIEPYSDEPPAMIARSPWSGYYRIKPIIWAYAHYGQFTQVGWHYIQSGCAELAGGGTMVTLKSDGGDFSIVAETSGAASPQNLTFKVGPGLSHHSLCVWRTSRGDLFKQQQGITPSSDGTFSFKAEPDSIYSISTTSGQQKGGFADIPTEKPFPFPYHENFDQYSDPEAWGYFPKYTADICGVFEIADRPDHSGKCLRQVVTRKAQSWAPEWMPYTVIGDGAWTDYEVSADIAVDNGGWAGIMGRVSNTGNGWDGNPNGYYARLYPDGGCALYVASDKYKGSRDKQIASGQVNSWQSNRWHNMMLRFEGDKITALVDGTTVMIAHDAEMSRGLAGLITGGEGDARNSAMFDNLVINRVGGGPVQPTICANDHAPLYGTHPR